jgi:hypothetical protein
MGAGVLSFQELPDVLDRLMPYRRCCGMLSSRPVRLAVRCRARFGPLVFDAVRCGMRRLAMQPGRFLRMWSRQMTNRRFGRFMRSGWMRRMMRVRRLLGHMQRTRRRHSARRWWWHWRCCAITPCAQHLRFAHRQLAGLEVAHDGVITVMTRCILGRHDRHNNGRTADNSGSHQRAKHALHAVDFHDALLSCYLDE